MIPNSSNSNCLLFFPYQQNDSRRFRVKFRKSTDRSATEICRQFINEISSQISVREISVGTSTESDSQVQMEDSQLISPDSQHAQINRAAGPSTVSSCSAGASARGLTLSDLANKVSNHWSYTYIQLIHLDSESRNLLQTSS